MRNARHLGDEAHNAYLNYRQPDFSKLPKFP